MKEYQRITEQREKPLVMSQWSGDSNSLKIYNRLSKLEDKIESGELVDRNEYLDRLMAAKDISGMSDKELEFFAKHNARVRESADAEIACLTADNAELRERLDKTVELPVRIGDPMWYVVKNAITPRIVSTSVTEITIYEDEIVVSLKNTPRRLVLDYNGEVIGNYYEIYLDKNSAEERLKELQGGER